MNDNRSLIERISLYIPGYKGYRQKNLRRDEDRAVRGEVARELEAVKNDLVTVQRATVGNLELMRETERIRSKADKYYIDVKKAVAGYSAFHDSVKIMEKELDGLIQWDAKLMDDVQSLKTQTKAIVDAIDNGNTALKGQLRDLERTIDQLSEDYLGRESIMKGFKE
ncbi:MAG: hypothetical protein KRP56_07655 [Candidatus Methanogranum gryphiswaldense]|nr:MAG: hypothetical protein KRP56_07655 [Candidatus Methanogranum sp. U3.2.1]